MDGGRLFRGLLNVCLMGSEGVADVGTRRRIAWINGNTLVFFLGSFSALSFAGRSGAPLADLASILALFLHLLVLSLNMSGQFKLARPVFLLSGQGLLFLFCAMHPPELNLQLFYFPTLLYPEILYGRNERWQALGFLLSGVICFLLFSYLPPPWIPGGAQTPEVVKAGGHLIEALTAINSLVAVVFLTRMSDWYEREDSLLRARLVTKAKMASLGEMAAGIAHEINNPLAVIQGTADRLQRQPDSPERGKQVETILHHCNRIAAIVRGLLTFAREGERDPATDVEVGKLLDSLSSLCQSRFNHLGVELQLPPVRPEWRLMCRPTEIQQVLLNLLQNGLDAVEGLSLPWVRLEAQVREGDLFFSVTDCGRGVDPAIADRLMEPFFTTKAPGKGTGLGLSISSGIARAHGGELYLDRHSLHTRFVLRLPLASPA